jgi:hypothetical protein
LKDIKAHDLYSFIEFKINYQNLPALAIADIVGYNSCNYEKNSIYFAALTELRHLTIPKK